MRSGLFFKILFLASLSSGIFAQSNDNPFSMSCNINQSPFLQFADNFDLQSCFLADSSDTNYIVSPIQKDSVICNCIETKVSKNDLFKSYPGVSEFYKSKHARSEKEIGQENYKTNLQRELSKLDSQRLHVILDASITFDSDAKATSIFNKDTNKIGELLNNTSKELQQTMKDVYSSVDGSREKNLLVDSYSFLPNQCVSPREFLAYNRIPKGDRLVSALSSKNIKDWDFKALKAEYNRQLVNRNANKSESYDDGRILELKEKILFLSRNPLIKQTMSTGTDESKSRLLDILGNYTKACGTLCPPDSEYNNHAIFKKNLQTYFGDEKVNEKLIKDMDEDWNDRTKVLKDSKSLLATNLESETREEMRLSFIAANGLDPDMCETSDPRFNKERCITTYAGYCGRVNHNFEKLAQLSMQENPIIEDLDFIIASESNMDFSKNLGFREFNETICDKKYPLKSDNNKKISFTEYRVNTCKSVSLADCRLKFSKEHEDIIIPEFGELVSFLSDSPVKQMSKEEAQIVANASKDIKNTRKKSKNFLAKFFNQEVPDYGSSAADSVSKTTSALKNQPESQSEDARSIPKLGPTPAPDYQPGSFNSSMNSSTVANLPAVEPAEQVDSSKQESNSKENKDSSSRSFTDNRIKELEEKIQNLQSNQNLRNGPLTPEDTFNAKKVAELEAEIKQLKEKSEVQKRVTAAQNIAPSQQNISSDDQYARSASNKTPNRYQGSNAGSFGGDSTYRSAELAAFASRTQESEKNKRDTERETIKLKNAREAASGITVENLRSPASVNTSANVIKITPEIFNNLLKNPGYNLPLIEKSILEKLPKENGKYKLVLESDGKLLEITVEKQEGRTLSLVSESPSSVVEEEPVGPLKDLKNLFKQ